MGEPIQRKNWEARLSLFSGMATTGCAGVYVLSPNGLFLALSVIGAAVTSLLAIGGVLRAVTVRGRGILVALVGGALGLVALGLAIPFG